MSEKLAGGVQIDPDEAAFSIKRDGGLTVSGHDGPDKIGGAGWQVEPASLLSGVQADRSISAGSYEQSAGSKRDVARVRLQGYPGCVFEVHRVISPHADMNDSIARRDCNGMTVARDGDFVYGSRAL